MTKKPKFYSITKYVDIETGELIPEYEVNQGKYYKIKTTKISTKDEHTGNITTEYTNECRPTGQTELKF